jgi:fructuronate reductase
MTSQRLSSETVVPDNVGIPDYNPESHGVGIVHIGVGAFHRAHQAVYTDDALAANGGDWRITGVSLRGTEVTDALNPQDGRYTLLERGEGGTKVRVIGSIADVISATRDRAGVMQALTDRCTYIVSLTVTEKAYGIDRATSGIDLEHDAIAHDLAAPHSPVGVIGLIVESLRKRRSLGLPPYTVLCCDNLPENGKMIRSGILDFAMLLDSDLRDWIATEAAFPCTMVDRITPAPTAKTLGDAEALIGAIDLAAVETEPFSQWVIEDKFPQDRPAWEAGGAIFVEDVAPYERMKLRMLNGSHSMIAYAGFLANCSYVRDAMANADIAVLVRRHLVAAAGTLEPLPGINFDEYATNLTTRFSNLEIAHETYQIAADGSEKLPQRFLEPAKWALDHKQDIRPFAFGVAAWMRYCLGVHDDGARYALNDPREMQIRETVQSADRNAFAISEALHGLAGVFPSDLTNNQTWRLAVEDALSLMLSGDMTSAIAAEARR